VEQDNRESRFDADNLVDIVGIDSACACIIVCTRCALVKNHAVCRSHWDAADWEFGGGKHSCG
jgi:hypothetical protein